MPMRVRSMSAEVSSLAALGAAGCVGLAGLPRPAFCCFGRFFQARLGQRDRNNVFALSRAGKRTAASVAWSGCASLRGPLCAGEAMLELGRKRPSPFFKLGAHSATYAPTRIWRA